MKKIKTVLGISTLTLLVACGSESGDGSGSGADVGAGDGASTAIELEPVTTFATQADAGVQAYATYCGACHGAGLEGTALGPMLSGGGFLGSYGRQSPFEFFNFLKANMPPEGSGNVSDENYWAIVAHVMRNNGVADTNPILDETAAYAMATNIPGCFC